MKDLFGVPITVGCRVAYAMEVRKNPRMRIIRVTKVTPTYFSGTVENLTEAEKRRLNGRVKTSNGLISASRAVVLPG